MSNEKVYDGEAQALAQRLGPLLKSARCSQELSLKEMEERTRIWAHQLEAMERGNFGALPNDSWARGLTVTYANALGLEGETLAETHFPGARPSRSRPAPIKRNRNGRRPPGWRILGPLRRHWKEALAAALGAIVATVVVFAAAFLFPYNPITGGLNNFLHRVAPDYFLATEPQRVAILADTRVGVTGEGNVITVKVARDDLGVLSVPRNTLVEIPDHEAGAVGNALALGGPDLTRRTVATLTGLEIPHYFAMSAEAVKEVVSEMGGVRIDVPRPISGKAASDGPELSLRPGPQTLNGDQALVYLQGSDLRSDVGRAERQQAFLSTMLGQALGPRNLLSNPATLNAVIENAQTNLSPLEGVQLAGHIRALNDSGGAVESRVVPGREVDMAAVARGGASDSYWVPDPRRLRKVLEQTLR